METYLNYDAQGFIVGSKRLEQGIESVHDDTQEIIQILKSQNQINQTILNRIAKASERTASNSKQSRIKGVAPNHVVSKQRKNKGNVKNIAAPSDAQSEPVKNKITSTAKMEAGKQHTNIKSSDATSKVDVQTEMRSKQVNDDIDAEIGPIPSSNHNSGDNSNGSNEKNRDSFGRFVAKEKTLLGSITRAARQGAASSAVNAQGVDPLIDTFNEVKEVLSPLGRMGGMTGRGAMRLGKFSFTKYKSLKRREPLPKEQQRHNKQNEETLGEILKRMDGGSGSSLLDGFGRFLGLGGGRRGGKKGKGLLGCLKKLGVGGAVLGGGKATKGLGRGSRLLKSLGRAKFLGPLATAIGIGGLASQWGDMSHTQKAAGVGGLAGGSVGATAGAALGTALIPIPVVGTAVGAAVGGWLGSEGGEVLGETAAPYIKSWTDNVKQYNLPQKMELIWKNGLAPVLSKMSNAASRLGSWVADKANRVADFLGFGGGSDAPTRAAEAASAHAIQAAVGRSLGKCALYINNAFRAQGLKASGHGVDAAKNLLELNPGKFEEVEYSDTYVPRIGDVMSMPSNSKSGHSYGHVAMYTEEGWVSDFKQGEKYGNTGAPNKNYYNEIKSGKIKPTVVRMKEDGTMPKTPSSVAIGGASNLQDQAINYFMSKGWTKEQAIGIAANLHRESGGFNADVISGKRLGDSGQAYGVAQWHPPRQKDFKRAFGKDIRQSTYQEQLAFIQWELENGGPQEREAARKLKSAKTAEDSAKIFSQHYERPGDEEGEKRRRAVIAKQIEGQYRESVPAYMGGGKLPAGVPASSLTSNFMPSSVEQDFGGYMPAINTSGFKLTTAILRNVLDLPEMPKIQLPLSSNKSSEPIVIQSNNDNIGQNVSDRGLAHAITGGLGESRHWG